MLGLYGVSGLCSRCYVCMMYMASYFPFQTFCAWSFHVICIDLLYWELYAIFGDVSSSPVQMWVRVYIHRYTYVLHSPSLGNYCIYFIYTSVVCVVLLSLYVPTYVRILCILDCCHLLLMLTDLNTYGWLCVHSICLYVPMPFHSLPILGELPVGGGQQRWQEGVADSCRPLLGGCS